MTASSGVLEVVAVVDAIGGIRRHSVMFHRSGLSSLVSMLDGVVWLLVECLVSS